ncbi:MaoC family dehydratase [Streptomyces heilongjiangensis]|uniref:MaoC family dehydratase n=1 Tax=Streptomyces heilongjiangensis TaxID=945052 RepID=A0ABW1BCR1_9ACTN|nr:MaoC/PaaZ C-terminal domain-containing protein [Streptomyces heilongjiangensis]MDC2950248.1 MaoC/PaaZ C-terminal domain-containing protein [Streptomyces heilongjiangensis]
MPQLTLTGPPLLPPLLARGALLSPCKSLRLPRTAAARHGDGTVGRLDRLVLPGVRIDLARLAAYERVCGFPTGEDAVPLTYPHVLGFPLAMRIMSGRAFPLPLLGLVHTSIEITRRRRLPATGEYELTVYVDGLTPHRRGTEATVVTEVRDTGGDRGCDEIAWESRSTYLARHRSGEAANPADGDRRPTTAPLPATTAAVGDGDGGGSDDAVVGDADGPDAPPAAFAARVRRAPAPAPLPALAEWRLGADVGRRYGAVSGDRNPIHLHPLGARLFGFPRAIAHGMWTVARCLAEHGTPPAALVRAEFRAPVPLPSTVTYAADGRPGGDFELRGPDNGAGERARRVHVTGSVYPLLH